MYKNIIIGLVALILISCSQKSENIKKVEEYFATHNLHNVNKTMKFYSPDAVFNIPGQDTFNGTEQIRKIEEWDAALNSNLETSSYEEDGDTVFVNEIVERNDWFKNMGIDSVVYNPGTKIIFEKGLIKAVLPSSLVLESRKTIITKLKMFVNWAKMVYPDELQKLLPEGKFDYKKENAHKWVQMLNEWRNFGHANE
jgi:SnoaL-like domain